MGMLLFGFAQPPQVVLNGRAVEKLEPADVDGRQGYRIAF
jgi:hypothetical protein